MPIKRLRIAIEKLSPLQLGILLFSIAFLVRLAIILVFQPYRDLDRYELERTSQKINQLHIQKAAQYSSMAMILPLLFFFQDEKLLREKLVQHHYMVAGYIAVWTIYIGYLLFLFGKLRRLQREGAAVGL